MALAVKKFFHTIPQLPYRFVADFVIDGAMLNNMRFAVRSVKYTEAEGNTSDAATYYGNGYYTIPIWDISSRALSITFEETDDMQVTTLLDAIATRSYNKTPAMIAIVLREYDNMFMKVLSGRCFWVYLQDYDEPAFSRTGGPSVVSINANFIVRAVSNDFNVDDATLGNKLSQIGKALNTFNNQKDETTSVWYNELKKTAKETKEDTTFNVDLSSFDAEDKMRYRNDTAGYKAAQHALAFVESHLTYYGGVKLDGEMVSTLALNAANNASSKNNIGDQKLEDKEIELSRKLEKGLRSTEAGRAVIDVYKTYMHTAYQLGGKEHSKGTEGLDCSGYVIAYLNSRGAEIGEGNTATTGWESGGLAKALLDKGFRQMEGFGGLKPGDVVVSKDTHHSGVMGHTMIFVGYDDAGAMIFTDSSGSRGVSTSKYTKEMLELDGYKAFDCQTIPGKK